MRFVHWLFPVELLLIGNRLFMSMKRKLEEREDGDPTLDSNKRTRVLDSFGALFLSILWWSMALSEIRVQGRDPG